MSKGKSQNKDSKKDAKKKGFGRKTFRKIMKYIRANKILLFFSLFFALLNVVGSLMLPILFGEAVDFIIGENQVDFAGVNRLIGVGILVISVTVIAQFGMNLCNNRMVGNVVERMRKDAIRKLMRLPIRYVDNHTQGELVSCIITDVEVFSEGLLMGFTQLFTGILTIVGTLVFMLTIDVRVTCIVVLVTPLSFLVAGFVSRKTFHLFANQSAARGAMTGFIDEMVGNQKVVRAFGREAECMERFEGMNRELEGISLKAIFFSSLTNPSTRFINSLVYAGVGIFGAMVVMKPDSAMTVGELSCFLAYANQYTKPFNEISGVITEFQNALACAGHFFEFLDAEEEEDAVAIAAEYAAKDSDSLVGEVEIEDISFSYTPDKKLIENFSLKVRPGQRVAIVGPTGCGKTTLINLLMRFYDVNKGEIRLDGTPIRDIERQALRSSFGMVLQETWLKNGTIRDNISFGRTDVTEEEIYAAAKKAHAHGFISRLPQGYDTLINEEGGNLSNGQKQLLCIARVMLIDPPMLILDEATSSIDTRTELKIQDAFRTLMEGRTSFIVAHRLSTIRTADTILVMKDGNIIEQGNHETLLAQKGFYYDLYQAQWA